jgi:hypothetical protein
MWFEGRVALAGSSGTEKGGVGNQVTEHDPSMSIPRRRRLVKELAVNRFIVSVKAPGVKLGSFFAEEKPRRRIP